MERRSNTWFSRNKRIIELSLLDGVLWASMASFAYATLFLKDIGMSTGSIGVLLSVGAIFSIIAQPIWGSLCDGALGVKKTLVVTVSLGGIVTLCMALVKNPMATMVIYIIRALVTAPIMALFDNYVVSQCVASKGRMQYGAIRIWGSISFALMVAALGWLTERYGLEIAFYMQSAVSFIIIWMIIGMVHEEEPINGASIGKTKGKWFNKSIFSSAFISFLLFVFLIMLSDNALNSFFTIILQGAGGSLNMIGMSSSIRAIVEVPFFLSSGKLIKRIGARNLVFLAVLFSTLRVLGFLLFSEPIQLLLANLLGAPSYCLFTAGMLQYVYEISPEGSKSTAQLIVSSIGLSLSQVVSSSAGGFILENYGMRILALCCLILLVTAFAFIMIKNMINKNNADKLAD